MSPTAQVGPVTLTLQQDKETKGTIRFSAEDEDAPIQQVYVDRQYAEKIPSPRVITITIEPVQR
jgi:hypothetical protein